MSAANNDPPQLSIPLLQTENLPANSERWDDVQLPIDILLLTAKECEFISCLTYLDLESTLYKSYHKKLGYVYFGEMGIEQAKKLEIQPLKIAVIRCNAGSSGPGSATVVVGNAAILNPKAVFCVGFCGGLNDVKVKLGDVVISAKLRTYASIKRTESGIQERGIGVPLEKHLGNLTKTAHHGWKAPLKDPEQLRVKVHTDAEFLSGPEVVDEGERRAELTKRFPDAIAIEMEGEGLFTAAHDLKVEWVVIKGVSDFADGKKSNTDSWRPFASTMAASLTAHMLRDPIVFQQWRRHEDATASEQSVTVKRKSSGAGPDSTQDTKRRK